MRLISNETLNDLEKSFGLDLFDEETKNAMLTDIVALISSRAGFRIVKEFSEKETEEFNQIPKENLEEMEAYILAKNPNAKKIFEEEAQKIKTEILNAKVEI